MPKIAKTQSSVVGSSDLRGSSSAPLIFISHHNQDAKLAEMFSKLLSSVSAGVLKSFRSSDHKGSQGIEYGVEWYPVLMAKLADASDVVCLLTQHSLDRPWILYEAGVAKGKLNTPVHGVSLGIPLSKANSGPFAQFQNSDDSEESLTKLVIQLVRRIPGSEPDQDAIQMQVHTFKEGATKVLSEFASAVGTHESTPGAEISVATLFEEVKVMFQDLPSRLELRHDGPPRSRFWRHINPMMLFELEAMLRTGTDDPIGLLIIAAVFRDDLPWLYEIGMEAYRAVKIGNPVEIEKTLKSFQRAVEISTHGSFLHETITSREVHLLLTELPRVIERLVLQYQAVGKGPEVTKQSKRRTSG